MVCLVCLVPRSVATNNEAPGGATYLWVVLWDHSVYFHPMFICCSVEHKVRWAVVYPMCTRWPTMSPLLWAHLLSYSLVSKGCRQSGYYWHHTEDCDISEIAVLYQSMPSCFQWAVSWKSWYDWHHHPRMTIGNATHVWNTKLLSHVSACEAKAELGFIDLLNLFHRSNVTDQSGYCIYFSDLVIWSAKQIQTVNRARSWSGGLVGSDHGKWRWEMPAHL